METVEAIKKPTQFICAEEDAQWPPEFKEKVSQVGLILTSTVSIAAAAV